MNALAPIVAEAPAPMRAPPAAVAQANRWIEAARPVLAALLAVEAAEAELPAIDAPCPREARAAIAEAATRLRALAEDIRQDAIAAARAPIPEPRAPQSAWDHWGEVDEALLTGVTPLEAAIRRLERERA